MENLTTKYIKDCEEVIRGKDNQKAKKLQDKIVSAFRNEIDKIDNDLEYDIPDFNSGSGYISYADYIENIEKLKCKLEVFLTKIPKRQSKESKKESINISLNNSSNNSSNNSNLNNNFNSSTSSLNAMFEQAKREIQDNESISEDEINEILNRIEEIEKISKSDEPKNKKWFKLKDTLQWLSTKGFTVGKSILNLITGILKEIN